jgi:WD40 repeat protein
MAGKPEFSALQGFSGPESGWPGRLRRRVGMYEESPRAVFAERFALLYAEAGNPPLKQVTGWVARARLVDGRGVAVRVSAQRVSDWRRGRNVPARFAVLAVVLRMLIESAQAARAEPKVTGLYDLRAWHTLWAAASTSPVVDGAVGELPDSAESTDMCPYRGLAVFGQADAALFFGRDRATTALLARLADASRTGGMVALVGASGSGKSSLLRAGLGPSLADGRLPEAPDGPVVVLLPGRDPVAALRRQIPDLATVSAAPEHDAWAAEVRSACARHAGFGARLVLIVDQFEEIFTLCQDHEQRRLFVSVLHAACATESGAVVVLGLRADFYGQCLEYPELAEALQDRQLVLGPMTVPELRDVITRPAKAVGLRPENGLVELLLRDLTGDTDASSRAGALPLLSHALLATWQRRTAGKLAGYRAAGGIHRSVATTAERAWAELTPDGRAAAQQLLLRLVRIGEDGQDTRRRVAHDEVRSDAAAALEVLAGHRLVTLDAGSVEITHEALLHAWPRLRRWIDGGRTAHLSRQRLEEDAATWARQDRDSSLLYRGTRLLVVERQLAAEAADLIGVAEDFLTASVRHRRRTSWVRRAAVAALVVLTVVASTMAVVAVRQRDDAVYRQVLAEADRLRATDPSLSAQLSLVAHRIRPDDPSGYTRLVATVNTALATPLVGHDGAVYLTSFSPDGRTLATASYDHTVRLWDLHDRSRPVPLGAPLTGHTSWVTSAVFSPDGRFLATAGNDHTVRLWDVRDPRHVVPVRGPFTGHHGTIFLLAFSPDGHVLATANEDHTVGLWNVRDATHPAPIGELDGHTGAVRTVAFSPDGRTLATGGDDRTVRLWHLTGPAGPPLTVHTATVHSVAFSPDGHTLATGGNDRTVRLWDVTNPAAPVAVGLPLIGHNGPVWSVKFSPDGRLLASGGEDGAARLWDLTEPGDVRQLGQALTAGAGTVFAVDFSPDGHALAAGSLDSRVRLWSLPATVLPGRTYGKAAPAFRADGRILATGAADGSIQLWDTTDHEAARPIGPPVPGHHGPIWSARFSPDGHLLATGSGDRTVRLWDVRDPAAPVPLGEPITLRTRYVAPLAFSPDGRILATANDDLTVQLWDIRDPDHPRALGRPLTGHTEYVNSVAFSPDGRILVSASSDKTVRLWHVTNPARPTPFDRLATHHGPVLQATFSPDGRTLATASHDTTIRLWDLHDADHPRALGAPLTGHTEYVNSVAFSPDGHLLASASGDKTVRLWNVTNPAEPLGPLVSTNSDTGHSVTFSPDGHALATTSDDALRLWNLDLDHAIRRICATTRAVLTPGLWHQHIPQLSYEPPCGPIP